MKKTIGDILSDKNPAVKRVLERGYANKFERHIVFSQLLNTMGLPVTKAHLKGVYRVLQEVIKRQQSRQTTPEGKQQERPAGLT